MPNDRDFDQILRPGSHGPLPSSAVPAEPSAAYSTSKPHEGAASGTTGMRSRRLAQERRAVDAVVQFVHSLFFSALTLCAGGIYLATQL